jgi:hypothetical protein
VWARVNGAGLAPGVEALVEGHGGVRGLVGWVMGLSNETRGSILGKSGTLTEGGGARGTKTLTKTKPAARHPRLPIKTKGGQCSLGIIMVTVR